MARGGAAAIVRLGRAASTGEPPALWLDSIGRSDSVCVDLPQPLVADAKVVRNFVLDDVTYTFGQVCFAAG